MKKYILAINPGSTSSKFALFYNDELDFEQTINHSSEELKSFNKISDQFSFRKDIILNELVKRGIDINSIDAVVGRGGLLKPIESGIYEVNSDMKQDLIECKRGAHASNLGGLIAAEIADRSKNARAFIVDPVVVDEMHDVARISGHPNFERLSIFHTLNQKAAARHHASVVGKPYKALNLVIAHLGGGISIGAHKNGKVIDVNNALNGEGPFSPERSGTLPMAQMVELCFSGKHTKDEILAMLAGNGGMVAYLGTNDFKKVCHRAAQGDELALLIHDASAYQVAKELAAMCAVLNGNVDAIILTGGMAFQLTYVDYIKHKVKQFSKVYIYPGEDELKALAFNGLLVLNGELTPKIY